MTSVCPPTFSVADVLSPMLLALVGCGGLLLDAPSHHQPPRKQTSLSTRASGMSLQEDTSHPRQLHVMPIVLCQPLPQDLTPHAMCICQKIVKL